MYTLKKCRVHILELYYSLFCLFWLLWSPSNICSYAMKRALIFFFFASRHLILLYKTSNLMKKWQQWVFNVMYYSTIYIVFKEIVLLFLPFVLYIFLLEWSCRANKAALIFFIFFFTYSHINLLFRNSVFHLRHFDSLSLQIIIIIIKKMFSKSLTVFCLCKMLKSKLFALLGGKAWTKTPRGIISSFLWWEGVYLIY